MDENKIVEKIIEEGTKETVGKAVNGVGQFLSKICLPAAEELGLYLKDKMHIYRVVNLYKITQKVQKQLENKQHYEINPRSLINFIDKASLCDDENIQNMWAGLLSGSLLHPSSGDTDIIYYDLLNSLSIYQARIIKLIYKDDKICTFEQPLKICANDNELNLKEKIKIPIKQILENSPTPLDYIFHNTTHEELINNEELYSISIGYIVPNFAGLQKMNLIKSYKIDLINKLVEFDPTLFGLDFYMNCTGYKMYPLETYLLTRKYWLENIK